MKRTPLPRGFWRAVDGILLLDKPSGMSSNAALQKARYLLRADKAGHTGSLDPLATGLLPICFGEATKIAGLLLGSAKAYETTARFGRTTDTDDADGETLRERPLPAFDAARLAALLTGLTGEVSQRPPIYSALKLGGVPAYRLARDGQLPELAPRTVRIDAIEVLGCDADSARLRVTCGSGTYIRSVVRDLGELLGCGAHVAALRRLWVAPFRQPRMVTLEQLAALDEPDRLAWLLPIEAGLVELPRLELSAEQVARLRQGQRLADTGLAAGEAIAWCSGQAIGRVSVDAEGLLQPERIFNRTAAGPVSP